jgi:Toc86/159 family protein import component
MATGVMTRDLALVEGARSAAEFAARVRSIADAQPAPSRPSDEAVRRLTTDLAPLAARLGKFQTRPNDAMAEPADSDRSAEPAAAVPTPAPATSSAAPTLPVPARVAQPPPPVVPEDELSADPGDKEAMTAAKLQSLRVNLLRIATRLGQSPRNTVVAQVIYRLELAEQLKSGKKQPAAPAGRGSTTSFDRAVALAERKEKNDGADSDLGFTCTILLLGKSGTGKSSTINSLLGENTAAADAFRAETKKVRMVEHKMHGMTLRLIDTPGLQPSSSDISYNSKIMADAKRFTRRHKPDIVLYFDRMDQPARVDLADLPLLKTITATFGASVWFNAIVVLTHGSSAPPDGQNGQPISYEMYFAQRSHVVQQIIRQAAGDMRLMNPVALAENHPM